MYTLKWGGNKAIWSWLYPDYSECVKYLEISYAVIHHHHHVYKIAGKKGTKSIWGGPERMTGFTSCLSLWVCCFFSRAASMFPMSSWTGNLLFFPDTLSAFWKGQRRESGSAIYLLAEIKLELRSSLNTPEVLLTATFFDVSAGWTVAVFVLSLFWSTSWGRSPSFWFS